MPTIIYFGGYSNYIKNLEEQTANPQDLEVKKVESSSEEEEEEEEDINNNVSKSAS